MYRDAVQCSRISRLTPALGIEYGSIENQIVTTRGDNRGFALSRIRIIVVQQIGWWKIFRVHRRNISSRKYCHSVHRY